MRYHEMNDPDISRWYTVLGQEFCYRKPIFTKKLNPKTLVAKDHISLHYYMTDMFFVPSATIGESCVPEAMKRKRLGHASPRDTAMMLAWLILRCCAWLVKDSESSTLGREVQRMVCKRLSCNQGSKFVLHHVERRWKKLMPNKTLQQQGIASAPFPAPVYPQLFMMPGSISKACSPSSALSSLQDLRTSKVLLRMRVHWRKSTLPFGKLLRYLPQTLQTLSFPTEFIQSLKRVTLPSSLQSLSFGKRFNQSLDHVTSPSSLESLTFGKTNCQGLERVYQVATKKNQF